MLIIISHDTYALTKQTIAIVRALLQATEFLKTTGPRHIERVSIINLHLMLHYVNVFIACHYYCLTTELFVCSPVIILIQSHSPIDDRSYPRQLDVERRRRRR